MISIILIKKHGLADEGIGRVLAMNRAETPAIFLFPEYTFFRKFTQDAISGLLADLPLDTDSHLFCSAYELETKEDVNKRMGDYVKTAGGDDSWFNDPLMKHFFEPRYFNKGYLVSGMGNVNLVSSYKKHICTEFDSLNGYHEDRIVKTKSHGGSEIKIGATYDGTDFSRETPFFPSLSVDGINLECRVCADIACGTENNPDIVLVSAHRLYHVYQRTKKSLNGKLIVVNDGGRLFAPVGYKDKSLYLTTLGLSLQSKRMGINVSRI